MDIAVLALHPLPYFDPTFTMRCINLADKTKFIEVEYKWSHVLLALMFLRVILIIRSLLNFQIYTSISAKRLL